MDIQAIMKRIRENKNLQENNITNRQIDPAKVAAIREKFAKIREKLREAQKESKQDS